MEKIFNMGLLLWVDDTRPAPAGWRWAKTNMEAIRILTTMEVSEVSLDHDISHKITVDGVTRPYPCAETYEAVARFLALLKPTAMVVHIHTANVPAGLKMQQILRDGGIDPILEIGKYGQANGLEVSNNA